MRSIIRQDLTLKKKQATIIAEKIHTYEYYTKSTMIIMMDFLQNILKRERVRGNERLATTRNKYVELYRREIK